jgi:hypothetical protein
MDGDVALEALMPVLNIFKTILQWISGNQSVGGLNKDERRYFNRYLIHAPDLIVMKHQERGLFKVLNLSYQGCLLEGDTGVSLSGLILPADFSLSAFGQSIPLRISKIEHRDGLWVAQFEHGHERSIQSIGTFVEPIRCGSTAVSMPVDASKTLEAGRNRVRFFGDGPFDLLVEKTNTGEIVYFMATIRRGGDYGSLTWSNGHLHTQKTIDHEGVAARMGQTHDLDEKIVWLCAMACLGLNFPEGSACARILSDSLAKQ